MTNMTQTVAGKLLLRQARGRVAFAEGNNRFWVLSD